MHYRKGSKRDVILLSRTPEGGWARLSFCGLRNYDKRGVLLVFKRPLRRLLLMEKYFEWTCQDHETVSFLYLHFY
jgi:hypothetical protein